VYIGRIPRKVLHRWDVTLLIDSEVTMCKFYADANAIYSHVKFASEVALLFLMETFCLPLLTYA